MTGGFIFSVNFEGKLYGYFIAVGIILITTIISGYITFVFSQRFLKDYLLGGFGSISITLLYVYFGYLTVNIQEILNLNFEEKYSKQYNLI